MQKEKKTEIITLRVTPQTKDRIRAKAQELGLTVTDYLCLRSEERRVGKECRSRWSPYH